MGKNNRHWHNKKPQRASSDYKPPYSEEVLQMSVEGLNLSVETLEILQKGGISTLRDIVSRRKNEMYRVQNFNKKKLFEVANAIAHLGVNFRPDEQSVEPQRTENSPKGNNPQRNDQSSNRPRDAKKEGMNKNSSFKDSNRDLRREDNKQQNHREEKNEKREQERDNGKNFQGKSSQNNSVDFSKLFPREKLVHSPRIEMEKDRFVKFQRAGKWGYKDENGKEVIPPIYTEALNFREDMAAVEMNGLFGYINRENVLVIPYKYDTAGSFSEGWANVSHGEKCGYVDKSGKETVPFIYDAATPFTGEGYGRVKKDGRWGNIRKDGEVTWQ